MSKRHPSGKGLVRPVWNCVVAVCMATLLSGCSQTSTDGGPTPMATFGPMAVFSAPDESDGTGFGAALDGRLVIESGCLVVRVAGLESAQLPVFPDSSEWDDASATVTMSNGDAYAVGDDVTLGGASSPITADTRLPTGCDEPAEAFYVNTPAR